VHWASLGADLLPFFPVSIALPVLHVHLHPTTTTTNNNNNNNNNNNKNKKKKKNSTLIRRKSELKRRTFK
jgi:hypothetical protein